MAKDWKSKEDIQRERDREDEWENSIKGNLKPNKFDERREPLPKSESVDQEKIIEWINEANSQLERISQLYRMYCACVDKLPPVEARKRLEQLFDKISKVEKHSTSVRFQFNALQMKMTSYRDRWDKMLLDFERMGKRRVG